MTGHFELRWGDDGRFFFTLKASNGDTILTSGRYVERGAASAAIASVRSSAGHDGRFERKIAANRHPYFVLMTGDGEVLGHSETYPSAVELEKGIQSLVWHAPEALVVDLTLRETTPTGS